MRIYLLVLKVDLKNQQIIQTEPKVTQKQPKVKVFHAILLIHLLK